MEINPSPKTKASKKFPSYAHAYFVFIYLFCFCLLHFCLFSHYSPLGDLSALEMLITSLLKISVKYDTVITAKIFRPELEGP